jgi:methylenetetrahydrofolate reductase (NADPH)
MNHLRSALAKGEFAYTAELVLGRDHTAAEAEAFVRDAAAGPGGIKIISLTDLPGGNPALPPEAFADCVLSSGLTPIAHLSGKDGNRSFLEARLHAFARMGVENLLALTGDAQKEGYEGKAKPVHDLDSVLILHLIRAVREGIQYHLGPRAVQSTPAAFFAGAVVNPFKVRESDLMMQFYKFELKVIAGAEFIVTQLGFDIRKLYELRQYMLREGLGHVPVLANVYVPTATIARMMQSGELAGCVVSDELVRRLESEKKPQRLERAALMVAAARDLGFAGAHIGGFGLSHKDFMTIVDRAGALGRDWRKRMDEVVFARPGQFHLFPLGTDGLSDGAGAYQTGPARPRRSLNQRVSMFVHRHLIAKESTGARFFASKLHPGGVWRRLLGLSSVYRKVALGCVSCGDCIQDHLNYAGCSMRWCYKELRNGPCGGSRVDGSCEARPELPCIWNKVYSATLAADEDPRKFARSRLRPRDWNLDQTNSLANRLAGLDGHSREEHVNHR